MADVIGVHGIAQQQAGRHQLLPSWQNALNDGIERAAGRNGPELELDLAYYGDLFLAADGTKGAADERKGAAVGDFGLSKDDLDFFSDIEQEVISEDDAPSETATKGFKELPRPVGRLAAWLDERFGVAGRLLFFGDLKQVRRFQHDEDLAARVFERVREAMGGAPTVLVGHSLGSVVAYEYLCQNRGHGIQALITLGSPLALDSIQRNLRTRSADGHLDSPNVKYWLNVYDPQDPVSLAGGLSNTWPMAVDETVENQKDPHAVTRYLSKVQTGRAVVSALEA